MHASPSDKAGKVQSMFAAIAGRYDLANHLLSGGIDFLWRKRAATIVKGWMPGRLLDLATGSGDLALTLQKACPDALIVGADFCQPMLQVAQKKGVPNLVVADALRLPFRESVFDAVTIAFGLRNLESWSKGLAEMARVLVPGGHLLILDFSIPQPPLRWIYRPYLHWVLPHFARIVTGQRQAYDYLADSIETFPAGNAMCQLIEGQGYRNAIHLPLSGGIAAIYTAVRQGELRNP